MKLEYFDPKERAREKAESRRRDEELLKSGKISPEELSRRNSFFGALDLSKARIVRIGNRPFGKSK